MHGGILADPTDESHRADMDEYGIAPIALVVGNLYPFSSDPGIELIDIGGPAMVRAAAKNHAHVGVVVDPADYDAVVDELRPTATAQRRRGAGWPARVRPHRGVRRGDRHVARRDRARLRRPTPSCPSIHLALDRAQTLRYGENPHQEGARYRQVGATSWWDTMTQHGGKALSYLNLFDTEAAWRLVHRFDDAGVRRRQARQPVRRRRRPDIADAYVRANACDPVSAFGGIVAANRTVTLAMATALAEVFTEVVVAPGFDDDALAALRAKKNLRVLAANPPSPLPFDVRPIDGGLLVQQPDPVDGRSGDWRVVTDRSRPPSSGPTSSSPGRSARRSTATRSCTRKDRQAFGIGAGQQNRLDSARIAADGRWPGGGRGVRERRVLPVPRRARRGRGRRDRGRDPAGRLRPRRRGDRGRGRTRHRHGVHRRSATSGTDIAADRRVPHRGTVPFRFRIVEQCGACR